MTTTHDELRNATTFVDLRDTLIYTMEVSQAFITDEKVIEGKRDGYKHVVSLLKGMEPGEPFKGPGTTTDELRHLLYDIIGEWCMIARSYPVSDKNALGRRMAYADALGLLGTTMGGNPFSEALHKVQKQKNGVMPNVGASCLTRNN